MPRNVWVRNKWVYRNEAWTQHAGDINEPISSEVFQYMLRSWTTGWHVLTVGQTTIWLPRNVGSAFYLATVHKEVR